MATKSLGHLSLATGTTETPTAACDMTSLNGSSAAVSFDDFNAEINPFAGVTAVPNPISPDNSTNLNVNYSSEGSRYNVRISVINANFTWSITTEGNYLSIAYQTGDYIQGTGLVAGGSDTVECIWDDGYNTGGTDDVSVTVSK